jgi:hypothetical protein
MTSSNGSTAFGIIAGAGLSLGWADMASAGQSFSLRESVTAAGTISFAPFDTSLGTLTEVDIALSSPLAGIGSTASLTGGEGGSHATAAFTADLNIVGPGSVTLFTAQASSTTSCLVVTTPGSCSTSAGVTLASGAFLPNPVALTSPTDLAFWDTALNVDLAVAIGNFTRHDVCVPVATGSCSNTDDVSFSGTVDVTYQYTPTTSTPEPWSIALFASSLAGLGFIRTRQRR